MPTLDAYDRYECRVGLGYSRFISEFHGIRSELTLFVPPGEAVLVQEIKVTNLGAETVQLDAIPLVESLAAARAVFDKYRSPEAIEAALRAMRREWDAYLGRVQVSTPDASMNSMLNVHNPRQGYMTKNWSRDLFAVSAGVRRAQHGLPR